MEVLSLVHVCVSSFVYDLVPLVKCQLRCGVCVGTLCHLLAQGVVPLVPHGRVVGAFYHWGMSWLDSSCVDVKLFMKTYG